ncbi:MAG TPA: glycosyltransferase [Vicinamibacterales bacterium]|nr:glycosyltransferase [Vicinamibacterales bacterium]
MRLAIVVQRYGTEINGGAELLARHVAERLARFADVQVLTTCAHDYVTWRNEYPAGEERVNNIAVRRFPVRRTRHPREFGLRSEWVFEHEHSVADELNWLRSEGPYSPALIRHIARHEAEHDFFVFVSFRYYLAYHGARAVPGKAVLIPTAEREPAIGLSVFAPVIAGARGVVYLTPEERAMVDGITHRKGLSSVIGVGSNMPDRPEPGRFRRKFNIKRPFAIYVGRIDPNKGCAELFAHFQQYAAAYPQGLDLVLIGSTQLDVPSHPRIRHLGYLPDEDKFDGMAAADVLIMPSPFESLSIVVLEAWGLGKPVLVNGRCDVLRGQCLRSQGGLFYETAREFIEGLHYLDATGPAGVILGRQGREYYQRYYTWPSVERKYRDFFERVSREPAGTAMAPLPGFVARHRRSLPPARAVLDGTPSGAVLR